MLSQTVIDSLFPADLPDPEHWERRYPRRDLPEGAEVTRFAPSPTGYLHIGGVYTATIDVDLARHSQGRYLVRIEDTDQARVTEGAAEQFAESFGYFDIGPDEDDVTGRYAPYTQSARQEIYLSYVRELLSQDKAYLCFATKEELADIAQRQQKSGALPGYYGKWALWRDASEDDVVKRLDAGERYVVRFRSPGLTGVRVSYTDVIRGELTQDDNRNDVVVLKSTDPRLPTYHLAHVVDDHLMRVSLVIRGEEWLSSAPLHHQLFDALRLPRIRYAHVAPLMKQDGKSRRKLSKRKDPEATVSYYIEQGYPVEAVQYYLRGLANVRLAELPLAEALAAPIRLSECGTAGPLVDMVKLDDISADYVAALTGEEILDRYTGWADAHDPELATVVAAERPLALRALDIERVGVDNPRKDLRKWSEFRAVYGYFFPEIFEPVTDPGDSRFGGLAPDLVRALAEGFADGYQEPGPGIDWFGQIRDLAARLGFAPNQKAYKQDPGAYPGSIREASWVIRILLTGSRNSPEFSQVAGAMGRDEVLRRVRAVTRLRAGGAPGASVERDHPAGAGRHRRRLTGPRHDELAAVRRLRVAAEVRGTLNDEVPRHRPLMVRGWSRGAAEREEADGDRRAGQPGPAGRAEQEPHMRSARSAVRRIGVSERQDVLAFVRRHRHDRLLTQAPRDIPHHPAQLSQPQPIACGGRGTLRQPSPRVGYVAPTIPFGVRRSRSAVRG